MIEWVDSLLWQIQVNGGDANMHLFLGVMFGVVAFVIVVLIGIELVAWWRNRGDV